MALKIVSLKDKDNNNVFPLGVGDTLQNIFKKFYPVGSYYKTTDLTFDPNTEWTGTTWVEDTTQDIVAYAKTNGTTIVASKNISSVTVSGGVYYWTLSKPMADQNGIIQATAEVGGAPEEIIGAYWTGTSTFNTDCGNHEGTIHSDVSNWYITIRGKLATPEYKVWKRTA